MYSPAIYRIGRRHPEFVGLWGGLIVEVSGDAVRWAKGLSFGQLRKECTRRRLDLTTADGRYVFCPEGIGYGDD